MGYHPHGIFTLGLILNTSLRVDAAEGTGRHSATWTQYLGATLDPPKRAVGLAATQLCNLPVFSLIMCRWTGRIGAWWVG